MGKWQRGELQQPFLENHPYHRVKSSVIFVRLENGEKHSEQVSFCMGLNERGLVSEHLMV